MNNLYDWIRRRSRIDTYTKIVLTVSLILWVGGTVVYAVQEWSNPATLGPMPAAEKLLAAFFQSVTMRTAGFNTVSLGDMTEVSQIVSLVLMFVGGASGSTAGGVKVASVGLVVYAAWMLVRGRRHITLFRRTVPTDNGEKVSDRRLLHSRQLQSQQCWRYVFRWL